MKWVEDCEVSSSNPNRDKPLGDFFSSILALVDKGYLVPIAGGKWQVSWN